MSAHSEKGLDGLWIVQIFFILLLVFFLGSAAWIDAQDPTGKVIKTWFCTLGPMVLLLHSVLSVARTEGVKRRAKRVVLYLSASVGALLAFLLVYLGSFAG